MQGVSGHKSLGNGSLLNPTTNTTSAKRALPFSRRYQVGSAIARRVHQVKIAALHPPSRKQDQSDHPIIGTSPTTQGPNRKATCSDDFAIQTHFSTPRYTKLATFELMFCSKNRSGRSNRPKRPRRTHPKPYLTTCSSACRCRHRDRVSGKMVYPVLARRCSRQPERTADRERKGAGPRPASGI